MRVQKSEVEIIQDTEVRCPECFISDRFKAFQSPIGELILKCLECGAEYKTGKFSTNELGAKKDE